MLQVILVSLLQILDVKVSNGPKVDISRASEIRGPTPSSILLAVQHGMHAAS